MNTQSTLAALLVAAVLCLPTSAEKWPCIPELLKVGDVRSKVKPEFLHCFRCEDGVIYVERATRLGPAVVRCVLPNQIPLPIR